MKLRNIFLPKKIKYHVIFYVFIGIATFIALLGVTNIETNNDVTVLLPSNIDTNEEREKINNLNKEFPSQQMLFVGIEGNPFSLENIGSLWKMCNEIGSLSVVKSALTPFNATYFIKRGKFFDIPRRRMFRGKKPNYPKTQKKLDEFMKNISSNRYLIGTVISYDKKTAGIVIRMNKNALMGHDAPKNNLFVKFMEFAFGKKYGKKKIDRSYFCNQVESVLNKYNKLKNTKSKDAIFKVHIAGVPVFEAKSKEYMQKDIFILIFPAILMMTFVLFLNFRTKRGTVLPILSIILSMLWTLGIIGWLRYKLNTVGILIPPIIMTVGSSYTLHYLNSYYLKSSFYTEPRKLVIDATKAIFPTITLAAFTTIVGFGSFLVAKIDALKMFAFFIIISIVFTLFFTFFLLSKILATNKIPHTKRIETVQNDIFSKILYFINSLIVPFKFIWVIIYIASIVILILVIPQLKIETNPVGFFKNSDQVTKSLIFLQKSFKGTSHVNIAVRSISNKRNYFKTKEGMEEAYKIQEAISQDNPINNHSTHGWSVSPVSLLEDLNFVMTGKRGIPENEKTIKTFFRFLKASKDDGIKSIINSDFSAINFQVRPYIDNEKEKMIMTGEVFVKHIKELKNKLKTISGENAPPILDKDTFINITKQISNEYDKSFINSVYQFDTHSNNYKKTKLLNGVEKKQLKNIFIYTGFIKIKVDIWGEMMLITGISKYLTKDQIISLLLTAVLVFLITLIIFRSVYYALFSLIPLSFGVIMNFVIMSIFGIPLDAATVMIAAISIGIGIDDSIHFILHYRKEVKVSKNAKEAVLKTLTHTSRPILFTSLALIAGFLIFLFSSFKPITFFGLLIAISMFNCTFATLFVLPSFFLVTDKLYRMFHKS